MSILRSGLRSRQWTIQSFFFSQWRRARVRQSFAAPPFGLERQQTQQHHGERSIFVGGQAQIPATMQANAVEQLGFIGWHQGCQAGGLGGFGVAVIVGNRPNGLHHRHALQHRGHFFQRGGRTQAIEPQCLGYLHDGFAVTLCQRFNQTKHVGAIHAAQHHAHGGLLQLARAKGNGLVGQAQCIPHGAARCPRQQAQRLHFRGNLFHFQHLGQVLADGLGRHGSQIELQAARKHGNRHLLRIGRGQHKLQILRGLLQRLQHGVKRRVGQHVHLVNHEDLEATLHRLVNRLFQQCLHFVHTPVGGCIQLGVIDKAAAINIRARLAYATRGRSDSALSIDALAIERLGQYARHGGLADTAGARKKVGVVQPLCGERVG